MSSVREILDAIQALPRPQRLQLAEKLHEQLESESEGSAAFGLQPSPSLELRDGFYMCTGALGDEASDHRLDREERTNQLIGRIEARRN